jgi:TldD protein
VTHNSFRRDELSRRQFVQHCTIGGASLLVPIHFASELPNQADHRGIQRRLTSILPEDTAEFADIPGMKQLALTAVDVARKSGATYAEAHLSRIVQQATGGFFFFNWMSGQVDDRESLAIGVRVLVNGYWGFASSPFLTAEDAAHLAKRAVAQATAAARSGNGRVELGSMTTAPTGDWQMPIEIDPFTVPIEERKEFAQAIEQWVRDYRITGNFEALLGMRIAVSREERVMATSEGACMSQRLWRHPWNCTQNTYTLTVSYVKGNDDKIPEVGIPFRLPSSPSWRGWELMRDAQFTQQVPQLFDEGVELLTAGIRPSEVGRYDVVFDAHTMASVLGQSLGMATELDRILGYESNAGGTSFLGPDPLVRLGTEQVASNIVTITTDRSLPGGLATTHWDAEGVTPTSAALVTKGVLTDLQTTRETVGQLAPYYQKHDRLPQSNGCAASVSALFHPMNMRPNLTLEPNKADVGMADMIKEIKHGLAVFYGKATDMDFQGRTGIIQGYVREIVNGKLGKQLSGASFMFNSLELWKNVKMIGGANSAVVTDQIQGKGQPHQDLGYSVCAVPAHIANVSLIDPYRRV